MPVIILEFDVDDVEHAEQVLAESTESLERVSQLAQENGAEHHAFYIADKTMYAVDNWRDEDGFRKFFDTAADIPVIMKQAGVSGQPRVTVLTPIETPGTF